MSFGTMHGHARDREPTVDDDERPLRRARKALRPLRRALAWAALVDEERSLRSQSAADEAGARAELNASMAATTARLDAIDQRLVALEDRMIRRVDALVSEVVHRAEARDARLATEITRLFDQLADQEHERTAILQAIAGPRPLDPTAEATSHESATAAPSWYAAFEAIERGSRDEVAAGFRPYLPLFEGATRPVIDLGCGRGEFLELARESSIPAYGVDLSPDAVAACAAVGVRAEDADLFEHLGSLPAGSLGGAFCSQVVEHLPAERVLELFELLTPALAPGAVAVIETPNPASFAVHVHSFWRDPTHLRPVPPPLLWFAGRRTGLVVEDTVFSARPEGEHRFAPVDIDPDSVDVRLLVKRFNESLEVLDDLLFGPQNYAVVLRKPHA